METPKTELQPVRRHGYTRILTWTIDWKAMYDLSGDNWLTSNATLELTITSSWAAPARAAGGTACLLQLPSLYKSCPLPRHRPHDQGRASCLWTLWLQQTKIWCHIYDGCCAPFIQKWCIIVHNVHLCHTHPPPWRHRMRWQRELVSKQTHARSRKNKQGRWGRAGHHPERRHGTTRIPGHAFFSCVT